MQTFAYSVGILIVLAILWFVFKVLLGVYLPLEVTGRAYLQQLLKQMDLHGLVPPNCVEECAAESAKFSRQMARFSGKSNTARTELVSSIELWADMLRIWIRGSEKLDSPERHIYRDVFTKYRLPRNVGFSPSPTTSPDQTRDR